MRHGWQFLNNSDLKEIFGSLAGQNDNAAGPFHLEIDPIDACNANCRFCNSRKFRDGKILKWESLHRLLEDALKRGLRSIRLAGGGEPTLYPHFDELMEWVKDHRVRIDNITTNGIRLTGSVAQELAQACPAFVMVSLNFATPPRYAQIMGLQESYFEEVCNNLMEFRQLVNGAIHSGSIQLHTQFMITPETICDLRQMFELATRLGVQGVTLRALSDVPQNKRLQKSEKEVFLRELTPLAQEYRDQFWLMFDLAEEGLEKESGDILKKIQGGKIENQPNAYEKYSFCMMPWYSMTVLGSGEVWPCCILLGRDSVKSLGNVCEQTLDEIWNGKSFQHYRQEMRRSMLLGGPPPMRGKLCRHTSAMCWYPRACPLARNILGPEEAKWLADWIHSEQKSFKESTIRVFYGGLRWGIDYFRAKMPQKPPNS